MKRRKKRAPKLVGFREARRQVLQTFETDYVIEVLRRAGGNVTAAAKLAELDRKHLWRLMRRNGIRVEILFL